MSTLLYPAYPDVFSGISSDPKKARIWVFGVPFDSTTSYRAGSRDGPRFLRTASQQTEIYDIITGNDVSVDPGFFDLGDMDVVRGDAKATAMRIAEEVENILKQKKAPLVLGGEHTISAGSILGASKVVKVLKVICLDAHADLRDEYEGSKYSHACNMRRVTEAVGEENLLEIGIREVSQEEVELFRKNIVFRHECRDVEKTKKRIMEFAKDANVYISLDIDVLDSSIVPGTGTPQPDGLNYHEAYEFLSSLASAKRIIGIDVAEVAPLPGNVITEVAAIKLLFQSISALRKKI